MLEIDTRLTRLAAVFSDKVLTIEAAFRLWPHVSPFPRGPRGVALVVASCGKQNENNVANGTPSLAVRPAKRADQLAVPPRLAELKRFGDWTVGCDNGRWCRAIGTPYEPRDSGMWIVIDRRPGPDAKPDVWINVQLAYRSPRTSRLPKVLLVDGQRLAFYRLPSLN